MTFQLRSDADRSRIRCGANDPPGIDPKLLYSRRGTFARSQSRGSSNAEVYDRSKVSTSDPNASG